MAQKFDTEALAAYRVSDVLTHYGLPTARRGPCPLCSTGERSTAFSHKGHLWICYACGEKGHASSLYARLGSMPLGRAIAEIACHLGLVESDPAEWDRRKAEREARQEIERTEKQAESWRLTRLAKEGFEAEREAEWLKAMAMKYKSRELLGMAYEAEGRMMVADYLLGME